MDLSKKTKKQNLQEEKTSLLEKLEFDLKNQSNLSNKKQKAEKNKDKIEFDWEIGEPLELDLLKYQNLEEVGVNIPKELIFNFPWCEDYGGKILEHHYFDEAKLIKGLNNKTQAFDGENQQTISALPWRYRQADAGLRLWHYLKIFFIEDIQEISTYRASIHGGLESSPSNWGLRGILYQKLLGAPIIYSRLYTVLSNQTVFFGAQQPIYFPDPGSQEAAAIWVRAASVSATYQNQVGSVLYASNFDLTQGTETSTVTYGSTINNFSWSVSGNDLNVFKILPFYEQGDYYKSWGVVYNKPPNNVVSLPSSSTYACYHRMADNNWENGKYFFVPNPRGEKIGAFFPNIDYNWLSENTVFWNFSFLGINPVSELEYDNTAWEVIEGGTAKVYKYLNFSGWQDIPYTIQLELSLKLPSDKTIEDQEALNWIIERWNSQDFLESKTQMPDSIYVKNMQECCKKIDAIYCALSAGDYAYENENAETLGHENEAIAAKYSLGWKLTQLTQLFGIKTSGNNQGLVPQPIEYSEEDLTDVHEYYLTENEEENELEFKYRIKSNQLKNSIFSEELEIGSGGYVKCKNLIHLLWLFFNDLEKAIGWEGAGVVFDAEKKPHYYEGLSQLVEEIALSNSKIFSEASKARIATLINQGTLYELLGSLGLPITYKEINNYKIEDPEKGLIDVPIPYPALDSDSPTLFDLIMLLLINSAGVGGTLQKHE